jgi:carbamoyl-phosphate synthase large subunit
VRSKARILLTSVGGLGVPRVIDCLRSVPELDLTIAGVDANAEAVGRWFVDHFFTVPYGTAPEYADVLLGVCRREGIDLIVPQSDQEALRLAEARDRFAAAGVTVLGSPYEATRLASNKFLFLRHLRERGVPVPRFHRPRSVEEVETSLEDLGYPEKKVAFKPLEACGSRGFRVIAPAFDELAHVLNSKKETLLSRARLLSLLAGAGAFPDFLLMEYLEGDVFSVDVLVRGGACLYVIPQRKLAPRDGSLEVGSVERNPDVERCAERVAAAFDFEYLINIDMAYRGGAGERDVLPFDLNARPSAVITATCGAGCFLLAEALLLALGVERARRDYRPVTMTRYWNEHFAGPTGPGPRGTSA